MADEWTGETHILTVHAVTLPEDTFDDGELEYDLEHPPSCKRDTCDVAESANDGMAFSLRYSGTPVTEPGTYRIAAWGRKYRTPDGDEYDSALRIVETEPAGMGDGLTRHALDLLDRAGLTVQQWARANYSTNGTWHGDICGCPDSRCANGFHHMGADDCGCLPRLLEDWLSGDPYRFFAFKPAGPVCRIRRVGAYNRQAGRPHHRYRSEARLTPRQRRRVRRKFNRTWF